MSSEDSFDYDDNPMRVEAEDLYDDPSDGEIDDISSQNQHNAAPNDDQTRNEDIAAPLPVTLHELPKLK